MSNDEADALRLARILDRLSRELIARRRRASFAVVDGAVQAGISRPAGSTPAAPQESRMEHNPAGAIVIDFAGWRNSTPG